MKTRNAYLSHQNQRNQTESNPYFQLKRTINEKKSFFRYGLLPSIHFQNSCPYHESKSLKKCFILKKMF